MMGAGEIGSPVAQLDLGLSVVATSCGFSIAR